MEHEDFQGVWDLTREITHASGQVDRFKGQARLTPQVTPQLPPQWRYEEDGQLTSGGYQFQATRAYLWQPVTGGFEISFDDGRFFHSLRWDAPKADHWCDPDSYRVTYDFAYFPIWQTTWHVTGPRKDYVMVSKFSKSALL